MEEEISQGIGEEIILLLKRLNDKLELLKIKYEKERTTSLITR